MKKLLLLALCTVSITAVSGSFAFIGNEAREIFEYKPKDMKDLDCHNQKIVKLLQSEIESFSDEHVKAQVMLASMLIIQSLRVRKYAYQYALNNNRQEPTEEEKRASVITVFNEDLAQLGIN